MNGIGLPFKLNKPTDFTYSCRCFLKKGNIKQADFKDIQGTSSPTFCMKSIPKLIYEFKSRTHFRAEKHNLINKHFCSYFQSPRNSIHQKVMVHFSALNRLANIPSYWVQHTCPNRRQYFKAFSEITLHQCGRKKEKESLEFTQQTR